MHLNIKKLVPNILVDYAVTGDKKRLSEALAQHTVTFQQNAREVVEGCSLAKEAARHLAPGWALVQKRLGHGIRAVFSTIGLTVRKGNEKLRDLADNSKKIVEDMLKKKMLPLFLATLVMLNGVTPVFVGGGVGKADASAVSAINSIRDIVRLADRLERDPENAILGTLESVKSRRSPEGSSYAAADVLRVMTGYEMSDSEVRAAWERAGKPYESKSASGSAYIIRSILGAMGVNVKTDVLFTSSDALVANPEIEKEIAEVLERGGAVVCFKKQEGTHDTISALGGLAYDVADDTSGIWTSRRVADILFGEGDSVSSVVVEDIGVVDENNKHGIPPGVMLQVTGHDKKSYLASLDDLRKIVDYAIAVEERER